MGKLKDKVAIVTGGGRALAGRRLLPLPGMAPRLLSRTGSRKEVKRRFNGSRQPEL